MIEILDVQTGGMILKLVIAMLLGVLIGTERGVLAHKMAGMRTYALVAMGSALFVIISQIVAEKYLGIANLDPLRMAGQVVVGIGFLGAGLIIFKEEKLTGLTTASSLWVSAGIGIAVGFGLFILAIIATLLTLFIFIILWFIEEKLRKEVKIPIYKTKELREKGGDFDFSDD